MYMSLSIADVQHPMSDELVLYGKGHSPAWAFAVNTQSNHNYDIIQWIGFRENLQNRI